MSVAKKSLAYSGMFEAELLVELMLRHWNHPWAADADFRNGLLESAAEALRLSISGVTLIDSLPPDSMNLVAALWYAEWSDAQAAERGDPAELAGRQRWLDEVRRAIPSCFCDPDELP